MVCFMEDACMAALWPDKPMAYTLPQYLRLQAALLDKSSQVSQDPQVVAQRPSCPCLMPYRFTTGEAALGLIGLTALSSTLYQVA